MKIISTDLYSLLGGRYQIKQSSLNTHHLENDASVWVGRKLCSIGEEKLEKWHLSILLGDPFMLK